MAHTTPELELTVVAAHVHQRPMRPRLPQTAWIFAAWMGGAALIAVVAGFVLGILAALEAGIGGDRWTQSVQAHGRLQLFGFVATFVVALAFEFLPRIYGQRMFPARVRIAVPGALAAGSLLMAAGQVWYDSAGALVWPGVALFLAGAVAFAVLAWRVPYPNKLSVEPQPLFLRAAAAWLVVTGVLSGWAALDATAGVIPLDESRAVVEVFLRGFVMCIVVAIALRAFVGHLGLPPLRASRQLAVFAGINGSLAAWLLAQGLGSLPEIGWLSRGADGLYGLTLLAFIAWYGVLRPLRGGFRGPRYAHLIPIACLGLALYAVLLISSAALNGSHPGIYREGAIRHVFLLGFMLPLMVAMAHIVLERFGTGRLPRENLLTAGFWFLMAAWPLRVFPVLFSDSPSELGQWLLATAGILAMAGLALVAIVCATVAVRTRRAGMPQAFEMSAIPGRAIPR